MKINELKFCTLNQFKGSLIYMWVKTILMCYNAYDEQRNNRKSKTTDQQICIYI